MTCAVCLRAFRDGRALSIHLTRAHKPGDASSAVKRPQSRTAVETCEICGVPWAEHPRCTACEIGIGPGHTDERPVINGDDDPYCRDCYRARWGAPKKLGVAA